MDVSAHHAIDIDPEMRDVHAQNALLRETGPLVPVVLPGGVRAWAATRHDTVQTVLTHPDLSKELRHWADWAAGEVPADWPLNNIITAESMIAKEGAEHRRLRRIVSRTFTARHVQGLRPRVAEVAGELLDALAGHPPGPVDLRRHYSYPLPRNIICELVGIPRAWHAELHRFTDTLIRNTDEADYAAARMQTLRDLFAEVIALRRAEPGDDLTSALIAARDESGEPLTGTELHDMVMTLFIAGHETTINLITNGTRALLTHPDQLALLRDGTVPWSAAVEETLRWQSPVAYFPMRYAVRDTEIDGVALRAGDAVVVCYAAAGRDPAHYGRRAERFRLSDPPLEHLSFGYGDHFCLGAALSRLETEVALETLFTTFPELALAAPADTLPPLTTALSNSVRTLPVTLGPRAA
ncbi:cytochrome P450 [Actinomadura logoneensis]|uniref:Cytochrome P450 n=1 Tax=Actinomadura logoneensis TaxID=2293572 RepID=A0A372JAI3_9ACTN|nr:cytochrome P450 [Actinomadura logoneensis]RFU37013.1 cytochrome P450 [Actinomadura logoneensis]